jgi:predicted metal-dependent phosphoesterase TrpH
VPPGYRRPNPDEEQRRRDQALRRAARQGQEPRPGRRNTSRDGSRPGTGKSESVRVSESPGREPGADGGSFGYVDDSYRASQGEPVVPAYPSRFDLHTHSRRSDGVLEPGDLVSQAYAVGIRVLALTDHDTLAGARELTAPGAPALPLELIPGVEINTQARDASLPDGELHVLGLGVDPTDEQFEATLHRQRQFRVTRFRRIVDRLGQLGYPIDAQVDEYLGASGGIEGASLGRPQIARCIVAAGFASSVNDAMQRLLLRGRPAYVPREGLGPAESISAIRAAGGLPSLAHFAEADQRFELVKQLVAIGLGGLEVHYIHFDVETTESVKAVARDLRLVPTGGSDYHGDTEAYAATHSRLFVPDGAGMDVLSVLGRARAARALEPARS